VSCAIWPQITEVKLILKQATARWKGGPKCRTSILSTQSGVLERARIHSSLPPWENSGTDPLELIAAAQAGSFSLTLSDELGSPGSASNNIVTTVTVTLELLPAGWRVMNIHLDVTARLPKVTQGEFIDATVRAKTRCLVTQLLRTNVSMTAKLEK
jgi:lipoyl-dependent peroxiredoxin